MQCKHLLKGVAAAEMFKDQAEDRHICDKDGSIGGYINYSDYNKYCITENHINCPVLKDLQNKCENLSICMMTDVNEQQPADLSTAKYKHICRKVEGRVDYIGAEHYNTYCTNEDNYKKCPTFDNKDEDEV